MAKYYHHDVARWEGEGGFHGDAGPIYLSETNRTCDQRRYRLRSWLSNFVVAAAGFLIGLRVGVKLQRLAKSVI